MKNKKMHQIGNIHLVHLKIVKKSKKVLTFQQKGYIIIEHEISVEAECGYILRVEGTSVEYVLARPGGK